MHVRKAVVLAAGYGTRLLPATKAQPKESLPLVDKPIIQYTVEEAAAAGITQVCIVTAAGKRAVEDHFDRTLELEMALQEKGDHARLHEIRRVSELADIVYVRQKEQKGIGHAVLQARDVVGNEPFLLMFPDDVTLADPPVSKQMVDVFEKYGGSVIAVQEVPDAEVEQYGIVGGEDLGGGVFRLNKLVEKPKLEDAPSRLAIVGRYVLTPEIFGILEKTPPGKGREIQITDALATLMETQPVFAYRFQGMRFDTGRPLGLLIAAIEIGLRRADIGPGLRKFLRTLPLDD
ncbi:MAG TPA: UTP--glucose-1-phosphate uridylyltransferase GalU [Dehalococcoidia bacterium]|nr:UTP--glucose-1-phosphate uridylyltransferase GalU [Dehalococcoidia bacterium]